MNDNFQVGDEVFLKSGGKKMTVEEIEGNSVSCVWFDKDNKIDRNTFPAATLKHAKTAEEKARSISSLVSRLA